MNLEVKKGVFLSFSVSLMALFFVGIVMIYPPLFKQVNSSVFDLLNTWWFIVLLGGYFLTKKALNISYLFWTSLITLLALGYNILMLNLVVSVYGISEWAHKLSLIVFIAFSLCQMMIRFKAGGYKAAVEKLRVIPGTFYFHPDNRVAFSLNNRRLYSFYDWADTVTIGLIGFSGGLGMLIEGSPVQGVFYFLALSIFLLLFSWFLFKVFLPDFILCILAGFSKEQSNMLK